MKRRIVFCTWTFSNNEENRKTVYESLKNDVILSNAIRDYINDKFEKDDIFEFFGNIAVTAKGFWGAFYEDELIAV